MRGGTAGRRERIVGFETRQHLKRIDNLFLLARALDACNQLRQRLTAPTAAFGKRFVHLGIKHCERGKTAQHRALCFPKMTEHIHERADGLGRLRLHESLAEIAHVRRGPAWYGRAARTIGGGRLAGTPPLAK